jgi:hypothetical protein
VVRPIQRPLRQYLKRARNIRPLSRDFNGSTFVRHDDILDGEMLTSRYFLRILATLTILATIVTIAAQKDRPGLGEKVLWTDPGDPSILDFQYGIGGSERQPQPPFQFTDEDLTGTSPKVNVTDGRGAIWNVKWGPESRPSTFCTRLVWACGYYAEPEYFVWEGRIESAHGLKRARGRIRHDGRFVNARFQLRSDAPGFLAGQSWTWTDNPFLKTHEFQGLRILMLLVSNWDTKDARDQEGHRSPNTNLAIFEDNSTGRLRYLYANADWGASMGKWGGTLTWTKWDCKGFAEETADFLKVGRDGSLHWGFEGKHRKDMVRGITTADIQWLLQYLGRITDDQIRTGLTASGATSDETECFARALRQRIDKLQQAVQTTRITQERHSKNH